MSNPFMHDDSEDIKAYKKMIISCIAAASIVILLFLIILYENTKEKDKASKNNNTVTEQKTEDNFEVGESNLVSSDLDFWDMYDTEEESLESEASGNTTSYKKNDKEDHEQESLNKDADNDLGSKDSNNNDENHIGVVDEKGDTIWYEILSSVDKNNYDFNAMSSIDEKGKMSYKDSNYDGIAGLELTKDNGSVDFAKVKSEGFSFVMLKVGGRGYSSGVVNLDEKFVEYATGAAANGLYIGVFFSTEAINEQEATEEANFCVGAITNYGIKYPVAIDIDTIKGQQSRTDSLTMKERTTIVKTFCETVKRYGFNPVIRGSRDNLITKLNLEDLNNYDFWLTDYSNPIDYPYDFEMLNYTNIGKIDGLDDNLKFDISFVRYEDK